MVVINGNNLPNHSELIENLQAYFSNNFSLFISVNKQQSSQIIDYEDVENIKLLHGNENIKTIINDLQASISPLSFFQVNSYIANKIYNQVLSNINNNDFVIDSYSGAGLLTAIMSNKAKFVVGLEIIPQATQNANSLVFDNNIKNIDNICGDASKIMLLAISKHNNPQPLTIVLDPPRKGCDSSVIQTVVNSIPEKIIYVSCNPATLARDLNLLLSLSNNAYKILSTTPYDMFPQTPHLETVVVLTKIK